MVLAGEDGGVVGSGSVVDFSVWALLGLVAGYFFVGHVALPLPGGLVGAVGVLAAGGVGVGVLPVGFGHG